MSGVHLAGHDRAAGLVLGNRDLADAAARARSEPANVVGDLGERRSEGLQGAVSVHEGIVGSEGLEFVGRGHEGMPGELGDLGGHPDRVLRVRVQARADRRSPQRELAQVGQ